jgi:glycosyltransferase involved in cell wall biosynthesis
MVRATTRGPAAPLRAVLGRKREKYMRIAQIAPVSTPVLEHEAGTVEQFVWLLSRELTRLGHDVTVFGVAGSEVEAELFPTLPGPCGLDGSPEDPHVCEWINVCRAVERSRHFDVLHAHAHFWSMPLRNVSQAPMVHTLHGEPQTDHARLWSMTPGACVTAFSQFQWNAWGHLKPMSVIPWSMSTEQDGVRTQPGDHLCFVGEFTPASGPREAIAAARTLGRRIVLAGPVSDYFYEVVAPLVDGEQVVYAGDPQGRERTQVLARGQVLVYANLVPEPFAPVLIEALLSGTPVAAIKGGAVAEVVDEGITGSYVESAAELPTAIQWAMMLDRAAVHRHAHARFGIERMISAYVNVYQRAASLHAASG